MSRLAAIVGMLARTVRDLVVLFGWYLLLLALGLALALLLMPG